MAVVLALLLPVVATLQAQEAGRAGPGHASAPALPLRSRAQLDAWLQDHASSPTPLDALSPGGRTRFLDGLAFGSRGLRNVDTSDLDAELTPEQARAVLGLFGMQAHAGDLGASRPPRGWPRSPAYPGSSEVEERYTRFHRAARPVPDESSRARSARINAAFRQAFPAIAPGDLARLEDAELLLAFRAALDTAQETAEAHAVAAVLAAWPEVERRGLSSQGFLRRVQNVLLGTRRFDQARQLQRDHPEAGLDPVPRVVDELPLGMDGPTLWALDAAGTSMTRTPADLAPAQVLVLAGCHFSQDAAQDIISDPELGPMFTQRGRWLGLPPGQERLGAWAHWNALFPQAPMFLIHDRKEWPMLDQWNMPTFVVLRDGRVVEQMSGGRGTTVAGSGQH